MKKFNFRKNIKNDAAEKRKKKKLYYASFVEVAKEREVEFVSTILKQ